VQDRTPEPARIDAPPDQHFNERAALQPPFPFEASGMLSHE